MSSGSIDLESLAAQIRAPKEKVAPYTNHPKSLCVSTATGIIDQCEQIRDLLLSKNKKYGDSAANPANIFAKGTPLEQIAVRCDDKIKRISNMGGLEKVLHDAKHAEEDTVLDLIGYLILARVVKVQGK